MVIIPNPSVVREFEYIIADFCKVKHALSVCNATIGILGVFHSLGLRGCQIITTPLTYPGAMSGLLLLGCELIFCDVDPDTLTINPQIIERLITPKTRAVFTADYLGYPARLDEIKSVCIKNNLLLIHDAASSFGAYYMDSFSGYFADVTILSFGGKKIFNIGEGGCILTDNSNIYSQLLKFLSHPDRQNLQQDDYYPFALNTNIHPMAAFYGLKMFDKRLNEIRSHQLEYYNLLLELKVNESVLKGSIPNFSYLLLSPSDCKKISNIPDLNFGNIQNTKLIYDESTYNEISFKFKRKCPVAEDALCNYKALRLL